MGRSQRHKVMTQGIASSQETWAQGVGTVLSETDYNEYGLPVDSASPSNLTGDPGSSFATDGPDPLVEGDEGGPLAGSMVQSASSHGGTAPELPEPEEE